MADAIIPRAEKVGYHAAWGQALLLAARARKHSGASRDAALAAASSAVYRADQGRDEVTRAAAAIALMGFSTDVGKYPDVARWSQVADAAILRSGNLPGPRARWLEAEADALGAQGKLNESKERLVEALSLAKSSPAERALLIEIDASLSGAESSLGEVAEAKRLATEADDAFVALMGPDHPERISLLNTLGYVHGASGDTQGALSYYTAGVALAQKSAPDYSRLPQLYSNICSALGALRRDDEALAYCAKAVESCGRIFGMSSIELAYAYASTGDILRDFHRYEEARDHYEHALAIHESTGTQRETDFVCALRGLGQVELNSHHPSEAIPNLERALELSRDIAPEDVMEDALEVRFALAQSLWAVGRRDPRVSELATRALEGQRQLDHKDKAGEIASWMRSVGLRVAP
jgi:tetratricopeptide (TPR) repeat protein